MSRPEDPFLRGSRRIFDTGDPFPGIDRRRPSHRWRPLTQDDRNKNREWKEKYGFSLSDMNITNEECFIYAKPIRSEAEWLLFQAFKLTGRLTVPSEINEFTGAFAEVDTVDDPVKGGEAIRLTAERLGGAKGYEQHIKQIASFIKRFRAMASDPRQAHGALVEFRHMLEDSLWMDKTNHL